jgi:hypothetical protein
MISVSILLLASSLTVQVAERDINWFDAHPVERGETLKRCHADHRLAQTTECMNAEASGTRQLGKPLSPGKTPQPTQNPRPGQRNPDRAS